MLVYGDWNGDGKTKVGLYASGAWYLDFNGNGVWDGPTVDKVVFWSTGQAGEKPVTGDWNGDGKTKVGVFVNGTWVLDYNGNYIWDGSGLDKSINWSTGLTGEVPITGDWNGDGKTKIAVYQNGTWIMDFNGNYAWDGTSVDRLSFFGGTGYVPVVGDWNGSGTSKMGAFASGLWALDVNGNYAWDPPADRLFTIGASRQKLIVGKW